MAVKQVMVERILNGKHTEEIQEEEAIEIGMEYYWKLYNLLAHKIQTKCWYLDWGEKK